jgi:hypothetical protein
MERKRLPRHRSPDAIAARRLFQEALAELGNLGGRPRRSLGTWQWDDRRKTRSSA